MSKLLSMLRKLSSNNYKNQANMLIVTSAIGWFLSSLGQIAAILCNDKIPQKEKSFLIPQEAFDGIVNIATFLSVTFLAKQKVAKMIDKGQIKFIGKDPKQYAAPVLTLVSIGMGALASNIITPFVRNYLGANIQKKIINDKKNLQEKTKKSYTTQLPIQIKNAPTTIGTNTKKFIYPKITNNNPTTIR